MDSIVVVYQTDNTKVDSKYLNNHCHENKFKFVLFFRVTQKCHLVTVVVIGMGLILSRKLEGLYKT